MWDAQLILSSSLLIRRLLVVTDYCVILGLLIGTNLLASNQVKWVLLPLFLFPEGLLGARWIRNIRNEELLRIDLYREAFNILRPLTIGAAKCYWILNQLFGSVALRLSPVFFWAILHLVITLPQVLILWRTPDPEVSGA